MEAGAQVEKKNNTNHIPDRSDSGYKAVQITAILWFPVEAIGMFGSEPAARKKLASKIPPSVIDASTSNTKAACFLSAKSGQSIAKPTK